MYSKHTTALESSSQVYREGCLQQRFGVKYSAGQLLFPIIFAEAGKKLNVKEWTAK